MLIAPKAPNYWVRQRKDLFELIPESSLSLLDVGCAAGALGQYLKARRHCAVVGIEKDHEAARLAKRWLDEVIEVDIESARPDWLKRRLKNKKFDCILFGDVLEHLKDPWRVLKTLSAHLDTDGVIVASLPNVGHYSTLWSLGVKHSWPYCNRGIHDWEHLRFFALKNVKELFASAGLEIARIERNFRIIEHPHKINLLGSLTRAFPFRELFVFQYLVVARKSRLFPPKSMRPCGVEFGENRHYLSSALRDFELLKNEGNLSPRSSVLDFGCGTGRLATGIMEGMGSVRRYLGIDTQKQLVKWCQKNISQREKSFEFLHLDIRNARYNPNGSMRFSKKCLPFKDGSFSHIVLFSVLTHMPPHDAQVLLLEVNRLLKNDGLALCTLFVKEQKEAVVINPPGYCPPSRGPLHRVQYSASYLKACLKKAKLEIRSSGRWIDEQLYFWLERTDA